MQIKHRYTGAVLWEGECENLREELIAAVKAGANLARADLAGANLARANLAGAYLADARGILPALCTPLLMLLDQPGPIRAYKLVTAVGFGPFNGGITYEVGACYEVPNACTDVSEQCAAGISLATLDWCLKEWQQGYRVFVAEFYATDIAAIPTATDGKFRVHRCRIVAEKDLTGLIPGMADRATPEPGEEGEDDGAGA